jgi:hypothetical protein
MWPDDDDTPEPAAWINFNAATSERNVSFVCESELASIPLWPEPSQRKPLTDELIDILARSMVKGDKSVNWLCRAIEKAHGIGDEE